jgi:hypothetical protein
MRFLRLSLPTNVGFIYLCHLSFIFIMFHVYTDVSGITCDCASDVNDIITQWFFTSPDITIYCELTDDDGNSLSYWEFTNGDDLLTDACNP